MYTTAYVSKDHNTLYHILNCQSSSLCYIQLLVRNSDLVACINLRKLGVGNISNILSPGTCRLAAVHGGSSATTVGEGQPQLWDWVLIVIFASQPCHFVEGRRALNSLPLNFKVSMESPV